MDNYDEWLTEMLIIHGVDRGHSWEAVGRNRTLPNSALYLGHWTLHRGGWHFTQKAVDYLNERSV